MYTTGFLTCLVLTALAIVLTLKAGFARRRRAHVIRAVLTVAMLGLTVVFAFLMKSERTFPADEMKIHRVFSTSVACLVLPLVITGMMLWRRSTWRRAHRVCIGLFLLAGVGAMVTGCWVLYLSTPIA